MTKEEILQFLGEKKQLLVPSDLALDNWILKEEEYDKVAKIERRGLYAKLFAIQIVFLNILLFLFGRFFNGMLVLPFVLFFWGWFFYESFHFLRYRKAWSFGIETDKEKEARIKMEEARGIYQQAISSPEYLAGLKNFPQEFYSTSAISRLESLIREERALTLQEAYTILENQQFQEQTVSHQHKMSSQQDEIVRNTRIAAAASTMAAISGLFNDRR